MDTTRWLTEAEQHAWRAILGLVLDLPRVLDADLATYDITGDDYEILVHLSEAPDQHLRMTELARRCSLAPSRLTYRFSRLERHGLVHRVECDADGRGTFGELTPYGKRRLATIASAHVEGVRNYLIDSIGTDRFLEFGEIARDILHARSASNAQRGEHRDDTT